MARWGPWLTPITGLDLVESRVYRINNIPFAAPGVYEFQLWIDGFDEPIAGEQVFVPEPIQEMP